MSFILLSKPIECMTQRVNPKVSFRLQVIKKCQCMFITCNKCTTLVGKEDNEDGYTCVWEWGIWEIFVLSPQFVSEPKPALNNKMLIVT